MDETILFPSPNWFQVSGLAVSRDNWLFYGGPTKSLCVLEPLPAEYKSVISRNRGYQAHVINRAHPEKIVSVDISPEWPDKKCVLTGSADGSVKQWAIERVGRGLKIKSSHSHEVHHNDREEIAGVGYSTESVAITVGGFGNIVKWELSSNVVKTYQHILKIFKPVCMACSPHIPLQVAVGTKQGVLFVLDLTGPGKIIYKVRGHDDDIMNISWNPQYETVLKKCFKESVKKFSANDRMEKIRNEPEPGANEDFEASGIIKNLPEDSFDETVVQEDDMFDIYKDPEADEFGHKKYQPEDIRVKIKTNEEKPVDYLSECLKLKEAILKKKNEPEPSIQTLVDKLDKTHVDEGTPSDRSDISQVDNESESPSQNEGKSIDIDTESSPHTHKHLLASVSKFGSVRIWSKSGKLVGSCAVPTPGKNQGRSKASNWCTLLWHKADMLLIADGKSQLLECNPLVIDCKNKLEWRVVHSLHKRGLHCIASNAPRVQSPTSLLGECSIWSTAQDRYLIEYCMDKRRSLSEYATCGGYLYSVVSCPYDAGKVAISVGDGAVRVWETSSLAEDDTRLAGGHVSTYWQNVQGKVLTAAWHPTKENLLAFATAESRVGVICTSGKTEKAARVLCPALSGGVYSLCWGEQYNLFVCAHGQLVLYRTDRPDDSPSPVCVQLEGQTLEVSTVVWRAGTLVCGTNAGAVATLACTATGYDVTAAAFLYTKMIHTIDWHPQETSSSTEVSPYKNLIATCSVDKQNTIVIVEYTEKEDGGMQLTTWKTLRGHKNCVLVVAWNPHKDAQLLSTSSDTTVRIWDALTGTCTAIFAGHSQTSLGAAWSAFPQLPTKVISGGGDSCLRLWDINDHPPEAFDESKCEMPKKERKKKDKKEIPAKEETEQESTPSEHVAVGTDSKVKTSKKFLLPTICKQINSITINATKKMLQKYLEKNEINGEELKMTDESEQERGLDFLKIFGSINEVNEVLDMELKRLEETHNLDAWMILSIFRGHIDATIQFAAQRDMLCSFLLSITPSVSFKYWKDVTQLYLAQVDRLVAKGEFDKMCETRHYGGSVFRKAAMLLSIHDIKGAVAVLNEARLFKEAYVLCRTRYIDSVAEQTLREWARDTFVSGNYSMSALCYLVLGDLSQAATVLGKSEEQESLSLAANIAKAAGLNTYADHVEKKAQLKAQEVPDNTEQLLEDLPSRIELLMKDEVENTEAITNGGDDRNKK